MNPQYSRYSPHRMRDWTKGKVYMVNAIIDT